METFDLEINATMNTITAAITAVGATYRFVQTVLETMVDTMTNGLLTYRN
jgi:hypothetical protein